MSHAVATVLADFAAYHALRTHWRQSVERAKGENVFAPMPQSEIGHPRVSAQMTHAEEEAWGILANWHDELWASHDVIVADLYEQGDVLAYDDLSAAIDAIYDTWSAVPPRRTGPNWEQRLLELGYEPAVQSDVF